ncbi:O-antigen ligase-related [Candidatus Pelagibacterales bacterium]
MLFRSNKFLFFFFLINWVLLIFSLNTTPNEIFYFGQSLHHSINSLRILIPLISSFIFIVIFVIYLRNNLINLIQKKNLISFLLILIFIFQFIGLFTTADRDFNFDNLYLPILGISSLIILTLACDILKNKKLFEIFIYALLLFSAAVAMIVSYLTVKKFGFYGFIVIYNFIDPNDTFFNQALPRVTGLARMIGILNIVIIIYAINKNLLKNKLYLFLILLLLSTILFFIQSRGAILCFYSVALIIIFFQLKLFFNKFKLFIVIFFIPVCFHYLIMTNENINKSIQKTIVEKYQIKLNESMLKSGTISDLEMTKQKELTTYQDDKIRLYTNLSSSGRIHLWKSLIMNFDKKKIFGYGPQADRFLLGDGLEKELGFGNNVSNAILYTFGSSGYFGLIIILLIYFFLIFFLYNKIIIEKILYKKNKFLEILSVYIIVFILIRSLFENSFSYFSFDFLLFTAAIYACDWKNIYFKISLKSK